jgi:hypothetical protein
MKERDNRADKSRRTFKPEQKQSLREVGESSLGFRAQQPEQPLHGRGINSSEHQPPQVPVEPIPEGQEVKKFEITEREKYLLEVMVHIIAQGYLPHLGLRPDPQSREDVERILRTQINRRTSVTSDTSKQ